MLNKNPSIVFIKPRLFSHEVIEEPLGILYVASYIRNKIKNIELKIIDGHLENSSSLDIFKKLQNTYIDFICISTTTSGSNEAYKLVNLLKNCNETKNIPIIWGGSHPTTLPEECLRQGGEFCVIGEGEVTTFELISHLIENKFVDNLPGIVYKNGLNNIIYNPPRKLISNLSDIPFPAFDLIDVSKYSTDIHLFPASNNRMALPIMTSRGCPNDCAFCCSKSMWRRRTRFRTIENVVDEIIEMKNNYNVSQFHFYDDNFLLLPDFAKKFAEKIIATDIDIKFTCQSSCQSIIDIDDEILKVLKESGMSVLEFGIESLNREVLKMINKPDYINNRLVAN